MDKQKQILSKINLDGGAETDSGGEFRRRFFDIIA